MSTENQVTIGAAVNGERRTFPAGTTLLGVVRALELEPDRVAIELDRRIVKRDLWENTRISADAEIEIVMFVGGG
ncbi:MAG: sulfur carrier protein ThiS [Acidobacteriota bacterium]